MVFFINAHTSIETLAVPLIVLDWSSRRLARMCRSILSAEAQSPANAVNVLDWVKVCIWLLINPTQDSLPDETTTCLGRSSFNHGQQRLVCCVNEPYVRTGDLGRATSNRGDHRSPEAWTCGRETTGVGLTIYNSWRTDPPRRVPDCGSPIFSQRHSRFQVRSRRRGTQETHHATARLLDQAHTQLVETFVTNGHDEIEGMYTHKFSNSHVQVCNECQRHSVDGYQFYCRRRAYHGRCREEQHPDTWVVRNVLHRASTASLVW